MSCRLSHITKVVIHLTVDIFTVSNTEEDGISFITLYVLKVLNKELVTLAIIKEFFNFGSFSHYALNESGLEWLVVEQH